MIAALRGLLTRWDRDRLAIWLETGGVTYEVTVPAFAAEWAAGHELGEELQVYTYEHATERQPVPTLFGFPHLAEREFFRKFIEVPDVGPAKAVRALTRSISEIAGWVEAEDTQALQQLPGIGARSSQTIVAHLRGKLLQEALLRDQPASGTEKLALNLREDAVDALVALQYQRREAEQVVANAMVSRPDLDTLEAVLRYVLEQRTPIGDTVGGS